MAYSTDRWITKITVPADKRTMRVSAGAGPIDITIPAGDYWCHGEASVGGAYPGVYAAISAALTTYISASCRAHSPYGLYPQCGIEFYRSPVPTQFTFHFSSSAWTLDKRLFGFRQYHATDAVSVGSVLRAPYSTWGSWVAGRPAKRKLAFEERRTYWATDDTARSDAYELDFGARIKRLYQYDWCQAAIVQPQRGLLEDHVGAAGLLVGDVHNAFHTVWTSLARLDEVLVVHDVAEQAGLLVPVGSWEAVKIATAEAARRFEDVARLVNAGGEYYELTIPTVVVDGTYQQ